MSLTTLCQKSKQYKTHKAQNIQYKKGLLSHLTGTKGKKKKEDTGWQSSLCIPPSHQEWLEGYLVLHSALPIIWDPAKHNFLQFIA